MILTDWVRGGDCVGRSINSSPELAMDILHSGNHQCGCLHTRILRHPGRHAKLNNRPPGGFWWSATISHRYPSLRSCHNVSISFCKVHPCAIFLYCPQDGAICTARLGYTLHNSHACPFHFGGSRIHIFGKPNFVPAHASGNVENARFRTR